MKKSKAKSKKGYVHFDYKTNLEQNMKYVSSAENISVHKFFPLIHFKSIIKRYDESKPNRYKLKERDLYYSSHIDRSIYMHYGNNLGELYNKRLIQEDISGAVIAYRTDLEGQSSSDFAIKAFSKIIELRKCNIMIGDFTSFFDNLDHKILKSKIKDLLAVKELSNDWHAVYKSVTRYSYVELGTMVYLWWQDAKQRPYNVLMKDKWIKGKFKDGKYIEGRHVRFIDDRLFDIPDADASNYEKLEGKLNGHYGDESKSKWVNGACMHKGLYKEFTKNNRKLDIDKVRKLGLIKKREAVDGVTPARGIPQGTAISAIFANVYMLDFDKNMSNIVTQAGGLYMRYSDDFIAILPEDEDVEKFHMQVMEQVKAVKLEVQPSKTQIFGFDSNAVTKVESVTSKYIKDSANGKNVIEYLGLSFDGNNVSIKQATQQRLLRKSSKKLRSLIKQRNILGKENIGTRQFRLKYTGLGSKGYFDKKKNKRVSGNFLSYEYLTNEKILNAFPDLSEPNSVQGSIQKQFNKLKRLDDK